MSLCKRIGRDHPSQISIDWLNNCCLMSSEHIFFRLKRDKLYITLKVTSLFCNKRSKLYIDTGTTLKYFYKWNQIHFINWKFYYIYMRSSVITSVQSVKLAILRLVILIPIHSEVYLLQPYMIMLNCDLGNVSGVLQTLWFPPPIKL